MTPATERKPVTQAADANGKTERVDRTPQFLQTMGITAGEWQFITKPQLEGLNQDGQPDHVRVWAVGMLHSIGYRRECAVKEVLPKEAGKQEIIGRRWLKDETGKPLYEVVQVPLSPSEIGKLTKVPMATPNVSRAINVLESMGLAEQTGNKRGHVKVTFFAKPRPANSGAKSNLVIGCDNQNGDSGQNQGTRIRIAFSASLRKRFFPKLPNEALPMPENLVIAPEYQTRVEAELEEVYQKVVVPEIQQRLARLNAEFGSDNHLVLGQAPAYKEESSSESTTAIQPSSSIQQLGELLRERVNGNFDDDGARLLFIDCQKACPYLDPPLSVEEIVLCAEVKTRQVIEAIRSGRIQNVIGLLVRAVPKKIGKWVVQHRSERERYR